jgi:hypothetical protein
VITTRFSADGRRAAIVWRRGLVILDVATGAVVRAEQDDRQDSVGSQPRDVVFAPRGDAAYVVRADEGVSVVPLEPWRALHGRAFLDATAFAVPRPLPSSELGTLVEAFA